MGIGRVFRAQESGLVLVIIVLAALLTLNAGTVDRPLRDVEGKLVRDPQTQALQTVKVNKFLNRGNIDLVFKYSSWTAIMAVGATILIVSGGIDLSVGAIYCLAAVIGGMFLRRYGPTGLDQDAAWVVPCGLLLTVAIGGLCGFFNGAMVTLLRVHPFIITLGTMQIFRGVAFVTTSAQAVTDYPEVLGKWYRADTFGGVEFFTLLPIVLMLLAVAVGQIFLRMTVPGRETFAVGGNETAAVFSGVAVNRVKILAFTIAGLAAGVAATIAQGQFGSADSNSGSGYELDVIAAAVVGGASLSGGRGSAIGAMLGALVIQLIGNGIVILGIDSSYQQIIKGAVIVVAVVLDRAGSALGQRRLVRG